MHFFAQHISLDYFNMRLADYELTTEAFAAFRSKQLQAPRSLILDPSSAAPFLSDETDIKPSSFLEDLHVVCVLVSFCVYVSMSIYMQYVGVHVVCCMLIWY